MLTSAFIKQIPLVLVGSVALSIPTAGMAQAFTLIDQIGNDPRFVAGQTVVPAQDFEPGLDAFDIAYLDDFNTSGPVRLTQIQAVFSGFVCPSRAADPTCRNFSPFTQADFERITNWRVEIYSSLPGASASLTGDVGSIGLIPSQALLQPYIDPSVVLVTLPVDLTIASSGTYWLGVIPQLVFSTPGEPDRLRQTVVVNSNFPSGFPNNNNSVAVNPGGGFVYPGNQDSRNRNAAYRVEAEVIPTPALLPGLIGLGLGIWRKRKQR